MTTPNEHADRFELQAALRIVLAHKASTIARTIRTAAISDGIDTDLRTLALLAETAAQFANIVDADQQAVADSYLRAMEYGDALNARLLARAASEYAAHIEQAHEASHEAETSADSLGIDEEAFPEGAEPTTAEAYATACRFYGV